VTSRYTGGPNSVMAYYVYQRLERRGIMGLHRYNIEKNTATHHASSHPPCNIT